LPGTLDAWAYAHGVSLRFIRPDKSIENAHVESFNGKFRDECLNEHWFVNLVDAKDAIERWRVDYNTVRPHSSLNGATPEQFARITEDARRLTPARPDEENENLEITLIRWRGRPDVHRFSNPLWQSGIVSAPHRMLPPHARRSPRVSVDLPILYRRVRDDHWFQAKIVNISESGVLFSPSDLETGTEVEVILSPPTPMAGFAPGKQVCVAEVVRTTEVAAAVRFEECRFLLEV